MIRNAQGARLGEVVWKGLSEQVKSGGKKKKKRTKKKSRVLEDVNEEKGGGKAGQRHLLGLELPFWEPETKPLWQELREQGWGQGIMEKQVRPMSARAHVRHSGQAKGFGFDPKSG